MANISKGVNHPIWGLNCEAEAGASPPCAVWALVHPPLGPDWVICSLHGVITAGGTGWGSRCGDSTRGGSSELSPPPPPATPPAPLVQAGVPSGPGEQFSALSPPAPPSLLPSCSPGICAAPVDRVEHVLPSFLSLSVFFSPSLSLSHTHFFSHSHSHSLSCTCLQTNKHKHKQAHTHTHIFVSVSVSVFGPQH